jgi:signal transduction histidine kinase/ligand-binding sensor domain-containing protein/DNA-binding NarL/FixJ family response regulator
MLAGLTARIFIVSCAVAGLASIAHCQVSPLHGHQSKFLTSDGLPNGYILAITQDADGFLWVATADGLARYDGKNFQKLSANKNDSAALRFNNIHGLVRVDDEIWLFYYNDQAGALNPRTFEISHFQATKGDDFKARVEIAKSLGPIELSDHDLQKLKRTYTNFDLEVFGLTRTDDNNICILTKNGFAVSSDTTWTSFETVSFPKLPGVDPSVDYYRRIFKQPDGRLAVIIRNNILQFDLHNRSFTSLPNPAPFKDGEDFIVSACQDNSGRLVFSSQGYVFLLDNDQLLPLWKLPEPDVAAITSVFVDRTNTLWVGSSGLGLYTINLSTPSITSYNYDVNFLTDLLTRELKIPAENIPGIWKINRESQRWLRSFYDDIGDLYLSNHGGVRGKGPFVFRLEGKKFVPLPSHIERSIIGLKKTSSGVWALNQDGEFIHWTVEDREPELVRVKDLYNAVDSPGLFDLEADENFFWLSSKYKGLFQLRGTELVDKFSPGSDHDGGIPNFEISDIVNDPADKNVLWIGTLGGGLVKWDKTKKLPSKIFTIADGLPNNSIGGIIPDRNGSLWITTNQGLSLFIPAKSQFMNYTASDGLFDDEFHRFMYFRLPDGNIAVGGLGGYSVFNPATFSPDSLQPDVHLAQLAISGEQVNRRMDINATREIDLSYDQNSLDVDVAVMQFNNPKKNRFRYKLLNYEDQWVNIGTDQHIRLSKLPYGNYTLIVSASNTSGIWSPNERRLLITIHPPWYLAWWAFALYAIFVISGVWIVSRNFKRDLQRKHEIELQRHEALRLKQLDETKTRFFSNVTHEFRTPLTLILAPLEKAIHGDEPLTPAVKKLLTRNHAHASQLLKLVNQLLDVSKLESGKMLVKATIGDLAEFVRQTAEPLREQAEEKGLQFILNVKEVNGYFLFDHSKLEKIIVNLLGNAVKFTSVGSVEITVTYIEKLRITVSDTGVGIDKEQQDKIFDRFYQVDDSSTRKHEGTGIGLSLVKEFAELMNGMITISSEPGKGTSMTIDLPVERIHETEPVHENTETVVNELVSEKTNTPLLLVVEDNDELRAFLVEIFSEYWSCVQAADGTAAWDVIQHSLPDIVISDLMMPGMSGIELCHRAKATPLTNHINFLILTAKASQESKEEGLAGGADDYITKPFHPHELVLRIRNLLLQQERLREHLLSDLWPSSSGTQAPNIKDEFLAGVFNVISANLDNAGLGAEMIAEAMAVSKRTLNRKLSAIVNLSVADLIKKSRVQKSVELIRSGYRISEIAYAVGFESPSYFARCFKEEYQKTPSEFAKELT